MPIYVYPQGPSAPISRLKRVDEQASANEATKLDVQQEVAIIGETIPLIFCKEVTDEDVTAGGCWTAPSFIALGLDGATVDLMYVLTQGRIVNLPSSDVMYGNKRLVDLDNVSFCMAYQQMPDCVEVDSDATVISQGPTLSIDQSEDNKAVWSSTTNQCTAIRFEFVAHVQVAGSNSYISSKTYQTSNGFVDGIQNVMLGDGVSGYQVENNFTYPPIQYECCGWGNRGNSYDLSALTNGDIQPSEDTGHPYGKIYNQAAPASRNISWVAFSYRTWAYRVVNVLTGETERTGTTKLGGDSTKQTLSIINLPPARYRVEFYDTTALRTATPPFLQTTMVTYAYSSYVRIDAYSARDAALAMISHQDTIKATYDGKVVENIQGNETIDVRAVRVYETASDGTTSGPDSPGGGAVAASYRNLTLVGITGPIDTLRPEDGPDYFMQLHCFCREGIYVKQQLQGMQLGPSNVYSDLVLHLFEQGGMLKTEQIDYQALLYAARFCEQYKLHFNGVLSTTNSGAEWLTRTAPYFLCSVRQVDGKYGLIPVVPIDAQYKISEAAVTPVMTLTTDDIIEDSYNRQYINVRDRRPVCLVMAYRVQKSSSPGQPQTIEVRYPGTAQEGPFETHDMTEFCVSSTHAAYAARYILAKKRYVEHTVELSIGRRGNMLRPGDIVQIDLALDTTDGAGITDSTLYEIEQIGEGIGGAVNLTLLHFPVDQSGVSLIAKDIAAGAVEIS